MGPPIHFPITTSCALGMTGMLGPVPGVLQLGCTLDKVTSSSLGQQGSLAPTNNLESPQRSLWTGQRSRSGNRKPTQAHAKKKVPGWGSYPQPFVLMRDQLPRCHLVGAAYGCRLAGGKWLSACLFLRNNCLLNLSELYSHLWWLAVCQHNPDCRPSFTPAANELSSCRGSVALNVDPHHRKHRPAWHGSVWQEADATLAITWTSRVEPQWEKQR